jgi:hypothetical protein
MLEFFFEFFQMKNFDLHAEVAECADLESAKRFRQIFKVISSRKLLNH